MKKAGLVSSHRGAQGGYVLNRKPDHLSLADIIEALEGPVLAFNGTRRNGAGGSGSKQETLLAPVWERIKQAELTILSDITIEQLAGRQRQLEQQRSLMYHI
jgi:Rrf2 family protein